MQVKIKKLHVDAVIPAYGKPGDAGMDLTATEIITDTPYEITYGTGLAFEIPQGYVGLVYPRSSIRKYNIVLTNSVGVVDSGYRGEIQFTFRKTLIQGFLPTLYNVGDRIGQMIIVPYPQIELQEVEELSSTERGEGGFGSSGN